MSLDAGSFPHILRNIIAVASTDVLIAFRGVSRDCRDRADASLFRHVLLVQDQSGAVVSFAPLVSQQAWKEGRLRVAGLENLQGHSGSYPLQAAFHNLVSQCYAADVTRWAAQATHHRCGPPPQLPPLLPAPAVDYLTFEEWMKQCDTPDKHTPITFNLPISFAAPRPEDWQD